MPKKPNEQTPAFTPDAGLVTGSQGNPSIGYETTDVSVSGVMIFLISLAAFLVVFFAFSFILGKVINTALVNHDGPANKWNQLGAVPHKRGKSLQSTAAMEQQQLQTMTQRFPTPRLQMDDGNQDLADMHQREDLLLDHYTWVNKQQGVVRVPIEQAMEMIVQKGLPVAPNMTGTTSSGMDIADGVTPPLTNGFARTTYEQEQSVEENVRSQSHLSNQASGQAPGNKDKAAPAKTEGAETQVAKADGRAQAGGGAQ